MLIFFLNRRKNKKQKDNIIDSEKSQIQTKAVKNLYKEKGGLIPYNKWKEIEGGLILAAGYKKGKILENKIVENLHIHL